MKEKAVKEKAVKEVSKINVYLRTKDIVETNCSAFVDNKESDFIMFFNQENIDKVENLDGKDMEFFIKKSEILFMKKS